MRPAIAPASLKATDGAIISGARDAERVAAHQPAQNVAAVAGRDDGAIVAQSVLALVVLGAQEAVLALEVGAVVSSFGHLVACCEP